MNGRSPNSRHPQQDRGLLTGNACCRKSANEVKKDGPRSSGPRLRELAALKVTAQSQRPPNTRVADRLSIESRSDGVVQTGTQTSRSLLLPCLSISWCGRCLRRFLLRPSSSPSNLTSPPIRPKALTWPSWPCRADSLRAPRRRSAKVRNRVGAQIRSAVAAAGLRYSSSPLLFTWQELPPHPLAIRQGEAAARTL